MRSSQQQHSPPQQQPQQQVQSPSQTLGSPVKITQTNNNLNNSINNNHMNSPRPGQYNSPLQSNRSGSHLHHNGYPPTSYETTPQTGPQTGTQTGTQSGPQRPDTLLPPVSFLLFFFLLISIIQGTDPLRYSICTVMSISDGLTSSDSLFVI